MSFLNPATATPKLGVNLSTLVTLRDLRPASRALDLMGFVQSAEEGGADAVQFAVDPTSLMQQRGDVDVVMRAMTEVHLALPLTRAMIDFALSARPHSVCFHPSGSTHDELISDASLQLIGDAVTQLRIESIQIVLPLDPTTQQLQAIADAGIDAVEFNVRGIAHTASVERATRFSDLNACVAAARRLGMAVHLGHGIEYDLVSQLVSSGEIAQLNVGYAIAARAMLVGWQTAVQEMKAAIIAACSPSVLRLVAQVSS